MKTTNAKPRAKQGPRRPRNELDGYQLFRAGPRSVGMRKYRNTPTVVDGIRFDSKREAEFYGKLKALRDAGTIRYFLRQVPFHLEGGVIYRADFLVFWSSPFTPETVYDVKGFRTEVYRLKKKQVEARYGITIREI